MAAAPKSSPPLAPADRPRAIALTGYGDDDDIAQTRAAGFNVHLTKPIDFNQLKGAIEKAMGGGAVESGEWRVESGE